MPREANGRIKCACGERFATEHGRNVRVGKGFCRVLDKEGNLRQPIPANEVEKEVKEEIGEVTKQEERLKEVWREIPALVRMNNGDMQVEIQAGPNRGISITFKVDEEMQRFVQAAIEAA